MWYAFVLIVLCSVTMQQPPVSKEIVGVYQGTSLFIQNPYRPETRTFCIEKILVNDRPLSINYKVSAIKIDFDESDLYTPVAIKIISSDSTCRPVILNPDAIRFHTSYKFLAIDLTDSLLYWKTEGERTAGTYTVEKFKDGIWQNIEEIDALGRFEEAAYKHIPQLDEGANKYRIKYSFGNGRYLYSRELDYDFYPEPVTFKPKQVRNQLQLSRPASYEIFDPNGEMVLSGQGQTIDVSFLIPADYVIYFDGRDPGVFSKIAN